MLYTKKGDQGTTKLFDCPNETRINKNAIIFEALGAVDELNSSIGYVKTLASDENIFLPMNLEKIPFEEILETIQEHLFIIQAMIGGSKINISKKHIEYLEKVIFKIETLIPPITSFIIPGGSKTGSYLDILRAIARRTERKLLSLKETTGSNKRIVHEDNTTYLNRLSSTFYALARFANYQNGYTEKAPSYS